jgi:hypothetical protein
MFSTTIVQVQAVPGDGSTVLQNLANSLTTSVPPWTVCMATDGVLAVAAPGLLETGSIWLTGGTGPDATLHAVFASSCAAACSESCVQQSGSPYVNSPMVWGTTLLDTINSLCTSVTSTPTSNQVQTAGSCAADPDGPCARLPTAVYTVAATPVTNPSLGFCAQVLVPGRPGFVRRISDNAVVIRDGIAASLVLPNVEWFSPCGGGRLPLPAPYSALAGMTIPPCTPCPCCPPRRSRQSLPLHC